MPFRYCERMSVEVPVSENVSMPMPRGNKAFSENNDSGVSYTKTISSLHGPSLVVSQIKDRLLCKLGETAKHVLRVTRTANLFRPNLLQYTLRTVCAPMG